VHLGRSERNGPLPRLDLLPASVINSGVRSRLKRNCTCAPEKNRGARQVRLPSPNRRWADGPRVVARQMCLLSSPLRARRDPSRCEFFLAVRQALTRPPNPKRERLSQATQCNRGNHRQRTENRESMGISRPETHSTLQRDQTGLHRWWSCRGQAAPTQHHNAANLVRTSTPNGCDRAPPRANSRWRREVRITRRSP